MVLGCYTCSSLNLQGYIDGKVWSEQYFFFPALAEYAEPGAVFDPDSNLSMVPILLHVLVIMLLNMLYREVAEWLTGLENHRLEEEHENSVIIKRFCFEAFECYIALVSLAFVQFDITRLRTELVGIFTADCLRRFVFAALCTVHSSRG